MLRSHTSDHAAVYVFAKVDASGSLVGTSISSVPKKVGWEAHTLTPAPAGIAAPHLLVAGHAPTLCSHGGACARTHRCRDHLIGLYIALFFMWHHASRAEAATDAHTSAVS